jgi:hypothetical protein
MKCANILLLLFAMSFTVLTAQIKIKEQVKLDSKNLNKSKTANSVQSSVNIIATFNWEQIPPPSINPTLILTDPFSAEESAKKNVGSILGRL